MNIIEALNRLRSDIQTWTANNLKTKVNADDLSTSITTGTLSAGTIIIDEQNIKTFIDNNYVTQINPTGSGNVSFGRKSGSSIGNKSVVIGDNSEASNDNSIAIGTGNVASGQHSTVIGQDSTASGLKSVALGFHNSASGEYAYATGCYTNSNGVASSTFGNQATTNPNSWCALSSGIHTVANGLVQHVFGMNNVPDAEVNGYSTPAEHLLIVGNGDYLSSDTYESNAMTLDWDGNAWFSGNVYVGSTSGTNKDSGSIKLATENQIPTESTVSGWGFTKNNGTITGIKMNGANKGTSGIIDLGTVITQHQDISGKVDKVNGKGLSTEDFTTALKTKLESLNNYNDAKITESISNLQNQLNTLVSGDANEAINSFNEIIAFLDGVKDTEDLESIISSIEQQIAGKMDKITLATVATSGSYKDLIDKPTIPDANIVGNWGFTKNKGTVTNVSTGSGLIGGDITSTGTIKCNLVDFTQNTSAASASGSNDDNRLYPVSLDKNGKLSVKVPWVKVSLSGDNAELNEALSNYITKTDIDNYIPTLSGGKAATTGKYVSGVTVSGHTVTVTQENLPEEQYKGTVTSITPGTGLTGASSDTAITDSGTINLKTAATGEIGGIKVGSVSTTSSGANKTINANKFAVHVDKDGLGFVAIPEYSNNSGDITGVTAGNGLTGGATSGNATLNVGAGAGISVGNDAVAVNIKDTTKNSKAAVKGGNSDKLYAVELDSNGKLAVSVPWTATTFEGNDELEALLEPFALKTDLDAYKTKQTAKSSPTTTNSTSTEFIDTISQDANGVITATKKKLPTYTNVTDTTVSGWGFTKNAGTITGIKMNGASKGSSGVVDLGTVITSLDGYATQSWVEGKGYKTTDNDTKNTAGSSNKTGTKLLIVGATSTTTGTTYTNSNCYVGTDNCLYSGGTKVLTSHQDISGKAPNNHASTATTYGVATSGTSAKYGHVKLVSGNVNGQTYADGVAAAAAHTHNNYLTSHQDISGKQDKLVSGTNIKTINGTPILGNGNIEISGYDDTKLWTNLETIGKMAYAASMQSSNHENTVIPELREEIAAVQPMISVTWVELKEMRDNATLKPGQQYRITDYVTTTSQAETQSAGHQFDIIVTADSENTLNEEARACLHKGDTYFSDAGAKLEAWQIWYSLDNDAERFAWADAENGRGVIYRMIDEWNNDLPYDFKNIMFVRYELEAPEEYIAEGNDTLWMQQLCNNVREMFDEGVLSFVWAGIADEDKSWEDDMGQILSHTTGGNFAFFTFNTDEDADASLSGGIHDNKMTHSQTLPNNVFFGSDCNSNTFGSGCSYNSFGSGCYSNTFGSDCNSNTFGSGCSYNSFGSGCYSNTFGSGCSCNTFGISCYSNSLGNDCYYNSFGISCYSNSLGNDCYYNSLGYGCYYNSFGEHHYNNTFGNSCHTNTFGNNCHTNTFGSGCNNNSLGNSCFGNSLGNGCNNNSLGNYCEGNSLGNGCNNNSLGNYCCINSFGEDCGYNNLGVGCAGIVLDHGCLANKFGENCDSNSLGSYCRSISLGNNCHYNSFGNFCYSISFGNYCVSNSFGNNCENTSFRLSASTANLLDFCYCNHFDDGCSFNVIWNSDTTGPANALRNINVNRGVSGTATNYNFINVDTLNAGYEIQVAKNSKGEIKIYCESDLIA